MDKIVIIGAGEFQRALISKAKEMGYETHVFAWRTGESGEQMADKFYPVSVVNREQILKECKKIRPKAVVSIASDIAMRTASYVSEKLGLVSNGERSLAMIADKGVMRKTLLDANLPQPDYVIVTDDFSEDMIRGLIPPFIVKPIDRTNARGISVVEENAGLMDAINRAREFSFAGSAIIENCISGREYSCDTISFQGVHQIVSFTKVETRDHKPHHLTQPVRFDQDERKIYTELIFRTLDAFQICYGATHIEFIVDPEGRAKILEISETTGSDYISSDLIPLTTGYDYLKAVVDIGCGHQPESVGNRLLGSAEMHYIRTEEDRLALEEMQKHMPKDMFRLHTQGSGVAVGDSYIIYRPAVEMGSFLPLELNSGRDYFRQYDMQKVQRLNSPGTALWYALKAMNAQKVYLPSYYAPKMVRQARELVGPENVVTYALNEQWLPRIPDTRDGVVVLANYFGLIGEKLRNLSPQYAQVVLDNSFGFFEPPVFRPGVVNIYSCSDFFGVSDGAYLIGADLPELSLEQDVSWQRAGYLLKALEMGNAAAYQERATGDSDIGERHLRMSELTVKLMDSIDYQAVAQRRTENYYILASAMGNMLPANLKLEGSSVPQCFPVWGSENLRKELTARKIYVPQLWKHNLKENPPESLEHMLAERLCPLPIDQRYGRREMEYMIHVVRDILSNC